MISRCQCAVWPSDSSLGVSQTLESLWRCDLVDQVTIDVQQNGSIVLLVDNVVLEYFIVQCAGHWVGGRHCGECRGRKGASFSVRSERYDQDSELLSKVRTSRHLYATVLCDSYASSVICCTCQESRLRKSEVIALTPL